LRNIDNIVDIIPIDLRNQISLGFHRVWQTVEKQNDTDTNQHLQHLINSFLQRGFRCSYPETFSEKYIKCYADRFWHTEINYDGNVYKCTMDYTKETQGQLLNDGRIEWDKTILTTMYSQATFENEMCKNCKLLPICCGPCSRKIIETKNCPDCIANLCDMKTSEIGIKNMILNHFKFLSKKYENINN
jgi:uncharacterized protein